MYCQRLHSAHIALVSLQNFTASRVAAAAALAALAVSGIHADQLFGQLRNSSYDDELH